MHIRNDRKERARAWAIGAKRWRAETPAVRPSSKKKLSVWMTKADTRKKRLEFGGDGSAVAAKKSERDGVLSFLPFKNGTAKHADERFAAIAHQNGDDIDREFVKISQPSFGERMAERVTQVIGSWKFLIFQSVFLAVWVILNVVMWFNHWDPYPFILMNLFLSMQAAFTAPMIMISQNRQAQIDRKILSDDFDLDKRTHSLTLSIHEHLTYQDDKIDALAEHVGVDTDKFPKEPEIQ